MRHDRYFVKETPAAPEGFYAAEAGGLEWLGAAGGAPVPQVIECRTDRIALEWIEPATPTAAAADEFGRQLARTHLAGARAYGGRHPGWIGPLPLDNTPGDAWPAWYAERRVLPYLRLAADRDALDPADQTAVEQVLSRIDALAGPAKPPSRIHGDLWSGNVLWSAAGPVYLIDPAAHGGHRETDLAMLALFGTPYLDRILAAYDEAAPLGDGWRDRVPLHQLHPLLVHAALFGGGYGAQAGRAARNYL